jgi:hypothetical protein
MTPMVSPSIIRTQGVRINRTNAIKLSVLRSRKSKSLSLLKRNGHAESDLSVSSGAAGANVRVLLLACHRAGAGCSENRTRQYGHTPRSWNL